MNLRDLPQPFRYGIVVGIGWVADAGLSFSMTFAGLDPRLGAGCGLALGAALNFLLQRIWVFPEAGKRSTSLILKFLASIGIVLAARMAVLSAGSIIWPEASDLDHIILLSAAYGISFVIGFVFNKYVVFVKQDSRQGR